MRLPAQAHAFPCRKGTDTPSPPTNLCSFLLPAPGLVPEPPGQMAEEGEVLGQEQCDG